MRHYLIVANQTAGSPALREALEKRLVEGPVAMHVVVPATGAKDLVRLAALSSDPLSGFPVALADVAGANEAANKHAADQLDEQLRQLRDLGVDATGEVGDADPMLAIATALEGREFDEILLSTLPAGVSRWLSMDLPHRVGRRFGVPLAVVECEGT